MKQKVGLLPYILSVYSIPIIFGFYFIHHYAVNVPYWDQWDTIVVWTTDWYEGDFKIINLMELQNDSRLFVPNVIMLLVSLLTNLNIKIIYYVGFIVYVLCILFIIYLLKEDMEIDSPTLILLIPLFFYAFNPYYMLRFIENVGAFTYPIMILLALITIHLLYKSKNSFSYLFGSVLIGLACTLSGAPGLTIWFAGLVQLILQKMDMKLQKIIIWTFSIVATFYAYFILFGYREEGLHSTGAYSSFLSTFLHYPLNKFCCFMGVVGAEVIHDKQIALFIGLIILSVTLTLLYINRKHLELDRYSKWFGILSFGTLTSLELALMRSGSESAYIASPDTIYFIPDVRHSPVIFLPIICIYILTIIYTQNSKSLMSNEKKCVTQTFDNRRTNANLFLLGIVFVLLVCSVLLHILPGFTMGESMYNKHTENQYALLNYEIIPNYKLTKLYPNPDVIRIRASKLEQYKLTVFGLCRKPTFHFILT